MIIHQAIYGDKSGAYSLLCTSFPDLEVAKRLCNTTDIIDRPASGVLTLPVFRGFSVGCYFLFIKSFPDNDPAVRKGRVLSHALIVAEDDIDRLNDLEALFSYFPDVPRKNLNLLPIEVSLDGFFHQGVVKQASQEAYAINSLLSHSDYQNTIAWTEEDRFFHFIENIWSRLDGAMRYKLKLGASFNPVNLSFEDVNIVYLPEGNNNKWKNAGVCIVDENSVDNLISPSSFFLAGVDDHAAPLENLIKSFGLTLNDIEDFAYLEKILPTYQNLSADTSLTKLVVLCDLLSKYSPNENISSREKSELLEKVLSRIEDASPDQVSKLKAPNWDGFPSARQLIGNQVSSWVTKKLSNSDSSVSSLIQAAYTPIESSNWWNKAVMSSFAEGLKNWVPFHASVLWSCFLGNADLVKTMGKCIPITEQAERDLVLAWTKPDSKLAIALQKLAKKRNWLSLHAKSVLVDMTFDEAIECQLEIDNDMNHFKALHEMASSAPDNKFVRSAVKFGDSRLIKIAGEKVSKAASLLKGLDVENSRWREIWLESLKLRGTSSPWSGVKKPSKVLYALLDLIIRGETINDALVLALSQATPNDLSKYEHREELWEFLPDKTKAGFIEATTFNTLRLLKSDDHIYNLEKDILRHLEDPLTFTKVIKDQSIDLLTKLKIFSELPNSQEMGLSALINDNSFSSENSRLLGKLISGRKWIKSAKLVKNEETSRKDLSLALEQCKSIIPKDWSIFSFLEVKAVKPNLLETEPLITPKERPIKILLLAINPVDTIQLRLDEEFREIEERIYQSSNRDRFSIEKAGAVRVKDLQRLLLHHKPDIVHISGHANAKGILLENNDGDAHPVTGATLKSLFKLLKNVRCVVLNACNSKPIAKSISVHIPYVIGMEVEIGDKAAIQFASGFYSAISEGEEIQNAFEHGRMAIELEGISGASTPVLFSNNL